MRVSPHVPHTPREELEHAGVRSRSGQRRWEETPAAGKKKKKKKGVVSLYYYYLSAGALICVLVLVRVGSDRLS